MHEQEVKFMKLTKSLNKKYLPHINLMFYLHGVTKF